VVLLRIEILKEFPNIGVVVVRSRKLVTFVLKTTARYRHKYTHKTGTTKRKTIRTNEKIFEKKEFEMYRVCRIEKEIRSKKSA
jgi:hypothetical protein